MTEDSGWKPLPSVVPLARVSITTRLRADLADALRGTSIRRQLHGIEPSTIEAILDDAVAAWLAANALS